MVKACLKTNSFQGFTTLMLGNGVIIGLNFLLYPFLTRLYSPSEFGSFSLFSLLSFLLFMLVSGQMHLGLFKVKRNEMDGLVRSLTTLSLVLTVPLLIVSLFYDPFISFVVLGSQLLVFAESGKAYFNRLGLFQSTSALNVSGRAVAQLGKLLSGKFFNVVFGLIIFEIIGNLISSLVFLWKVKPTFGFKGCFKYWKTSGYFLPLSLLSWIVGEWSLLVIAKVMTLEVLGQFFLFSRLVLKPVTIIGNNLASSLINQLNDVQKWTRLFKVFCLILGAAIPVVFALHLWGERLFSYVLGAEYKEVGYYASFLGFLVIVKIFKGVISVRSSQTERYATVISIRSLILFAYVMSTFLLKGDLKLMLIVLGLIEFFGETILMFCLFKKQDVINE